MLGFNKYKKTTRSRLKKISYLFLIFLISCATTSQNRTPSQALPMDETLDFMFEEFEGGSFENEKKINGELVGVAQEMMTKMQKKSKDGIMTRDAHAKSHGCLKAKFEVNNKELPENLRLGMFKNNQSYDAWVRFSNNDHLPIRRDNEYDLRGMSIKVMGVLGPKIMAGFESAPTQDFLMYGSNHFFIKDNKDYIGFMKGLRDDNAAFVLLTQQPQAAAKTLYAQWKVSGFTNPVNMPYHSAVPIRLGLEENEKRKAIKYRAIPCANSAHASPVPKSSFNYLRENLKNTLDKEDACFLFQVQIQTDSKTMPIEDATAIWPETSGLLAKGSPYITVAEVLIPKQEFDTRERDNYCENLTITPWHALVEHKPLGRTMRMRRDLYKATSRFRHQSNGIPLVEPQGFEIK